MFQNVFKFLKDFYHNSGTWILASSIFNKLILFAIKVFILIYIEKEVVGQITYAIALIAFFTPFVGLGSPAGLLRYGSIAGESKQRRSITNYAFSWGLALTLLLIIILIPSIYYFEGNKPVIWAFLTIIIWRILSLFLNNHQSVQMRIDGKNKLFGQYDMVNSLIILVSAITLTYLFHAKGYLVAIVASPIIAFIIYSVLYGFPKLRFQSPLGAETSTFWSYSLLSSFTSVVAQMVFLVDVYIIEKFMTSSDVAEYSAATLIPLNVLIFPMIFMKTDFTKIAQNDSNPTFLRHYYYNYFKLFLVLCVVGMGLSYLLGEWMFSFLGGAYSPFNLFMILMIGACFALLFRVPLTGIISAVGHAKVNTITGLITLGISIGLNLWWIPIYGLEGAAWATTLSLLLSGLMSWFYFEWYIKSISARS